MLCSKQFCQLTTVNGCDSVAVLNLTIIEPDSSFTDVTAVKAMNGMEQLTQRVAASLILKNNILTKTR